MNEIRFTFPLDGDVLTPADGEIKDGKLHIRVSLTAPAHSIVTVNGTQCDLISEKDGIGCYEITAVTEN